jgi:hypothetical protein
MDEMSLLDLNRDIFLKITQYLNGTSLRNYIGIGEETYDWTNHIHYALYRLKFDELPIRHHVEEPKEYKYIFQRKIGTVYEIHEPIILKEKTLDNIFEIKFKYDFVQYLSVNILDSEDHNTFVKIALACGSDVFGTSNYRINREGYIMCSLREAGKRAKILEHDEITFILNMLPDKDIAYYYVNGVISRNIINKITHTPKQIGFSGIFTMTMVSMKHLKHTPIGPPVKYVFWNYDGGNFLINKDKVVNKIWD